MLKNRRPEQMIHLKKFLILALAGTLFTGCGGSGESPSGTAVSSETAQNGDGQSGEASSEQNGDDVKGPETKEEPDSTETPDATETPEPTKKPKTYVQKSKFKAGEQIYTDNVRTVTALGLKEYRELKSKEYTDKPAKGHVYVVLFLDVLNGDKEDLFIHPDYLSAAVDGKSVEHTVLYHQPEHYSTMFRNIAAGEHADGFIVWEVPKDWKKMVMKFTEFELFGNKRLVLTFGKKDLADPGSPSTQAE